MKISRDSVELNEILKHNADDLLSDFNEEKLSYNTNLLTEQSDDEYLNNRGEDYLEALTINKEFRERLGRLDFKLIDEVYIKKYFNNYCIEERNKELESLNVVDLFSGAGGLSLGFVQEGFGVNLAVDFDKSTVETYRFNHPKVHSKYILHRDIQDIENEIPDYLRKKEVDIVIGGPPCQGFSIANQQRIIDDSRNKLYKSFVKIVSLTSPKYFVMENVKGMSKVANQIKEDFEKIGYKVDYEVLQAIEFGIPQNRERLIFIGTKSSINPKNIFHMIREEKEGRKKMVLRDAIGDLPQLEASTRKNRTDLINNKNGGIVIKKSHHEKANDYIKLINPDQPPSRVIFNHQARYNNDRDIEIYGLLNQGDNSTDEKIKHIMPYTNRNHIFKDKYFKLIYAQPCKTITAHMRFDCNMYIHPTQARGLTPREAARVQSYPDDYIFKDAYTKTYMQIGNSVPPLMGRTIARVLKRLLKGEV